MQVEYCRRKTPSSGKKSKQTVAIMYTTHILFVIHWCGMLSVALFGTGVDSACKNRPNNTLMTTNPNVDGACGNIDIRNDIKLFRLLENCTVIEGQLSILLIDKYEDNDFEKYQFPLLREITGHLLIYRVYGLKNLRHMFPNLAVIRGQDLFYNYALVVYEMPDLEELGLISLTSIMRGAVRITKNARLCYVNTIDWSQIAVGGDIVHHIQENKDQTKCVNLCPDNCTVSVVDGESARRCWTAQHCQKNLDCNCKKRVSDNETGACIEGTNKCCSSDCIGGCREVVKNGKKEEQCLACNKVVYLDKCYPECPPTTYMYMKRRCLTPQQCINLTHATKLKTNGWILFKPVPSGSGIWECVEECPTGYILDSNSKKECIKCNNSCPKVCIGKVVDSIDSAQHLKGCNKVEGALEIHIMGGSNIGVELEENLGSIEEVTRYIKVVRSYALLSLHFFKSLRIIHGYPTETSESASLVVRDNSNLQELFTEEVTKNLRIMNGTVNFHSNRKLCLYKIDDLVEHLGLKNNITEHDVSRTMNGDLMPCSVTKLNLTIQSTFKEVVVITWPKIQSSDQRQLLSYLIHFREVTSEMVNIYQGRDACSDTIWKTIDTVGQDTNNSDNLVELIPGLKPWTRYAIYVQAQMLTTAVSQMLSDVVIFRTAANYPTSPTDLQAVAKDPGELLVTWNPPKVPNGNVTHYFVYWQKQAIDAEPFNQRDYCVNPITPMKEQNLPNEHEQTKNTTASNSGCCTCPKSKEKIKEEEHERMIEIQFENYLHDNVYCKRDDQIDEISIDHKYDFLTLKKHKKRDTSSGTEAPLTPYSAESNVNLNINGSTTPPPTTAPTNGNNQMQENPFHQIIVYDTKITLTNLGHFQDYNIEVLACQEFDKENTQPKLCSNRVITVARTKPMENADNINASTVEASAIINSTGQVMIKWEQPTNPNGLIIKYLIRYHRANSDVCLYLSTTLCLTCTGSGWKLYCRCNICTILSVCTQLCCQIEMIRYNHRKSINYYS